MSQEQTPSTEVARHFIDEIIQEDLQSGKHTEVVTRFPPEPNGYLHLGHAKSICLNFGLAQKYGGRCHLRFDDTNPTKEDVEYVESIQEDVKWLGFSWGENLHYTSDHFEQLFDWACQLIRQGDAYVDDQTPEQMRAGRGTVTEPGTNSPFRERSADENVELFVQMREGKFKDGEKVLRAKIDMAHSNMLFRDPVLYRIYHHHHPRTADNWCIYPMYDFAHGQCDSLETITHSICTLEFEVHRPLYEWLQQHLGIHETRQIEFARLNLSHTLMSKRKLLSLVQEGVVSGWDDPRMPTIAGMRRRGFTPAGLRTFCDTIGVARRDNTIELALLEYCMRQDLNKVAQRRMAVLNPLKVVITDYPEDKVEWMPVPNNPENEADGKRDIPFTRELWIERDDFMEDAPKKFFRLKPGGEVRLRGGYWIRCQEVIKNDAGEIVELRCTHDPETRGGSNPPPDADGKVRKVKGTLHWVSANHAKPAEIRLYDTLFVSENPDDAPEGEDWHSNLNPESLKTVNAWVEPSLVEADPGSPIQFERIGYFTPDIDSGEEQLIFNRTLTLKDSFAKAMKGK